MSPPQPPTGARTLGALLVEETTAFFRPLKTAAQDPETLSEFLLTLFPSVSQSELDALETAAQDLVTEVDQLPNKLSSDSPTWVDLLELLADVADLLNAVLAFEDFLQGPDAAGAGTVLLNRLFVDYLQSEHPSLLYVGILLTLVEWPAPDAEARQAIDRSGTLYALSGRATPRLDRLPDLLSDPVGTLKDGHLSDPPTDADLQRLETLIFPWFSGLVEVMGSQNEYVFVPESNDTSQLPDYEFAEYTWTVYRNDNAGLTRLGFVSLVFTDDGIGLAIQPEADFDTQFTADDWEFALALQTALNAVVVDKTGLSFTDGSSGTVTGSVDITKKPPAGADALFTFGPPDGTRLELGRFESHTSLTAGTDTVEADVLAAMRDSEFVFTPGGGFLAAMLPEDGAGAKFDLGIGWSTAKGVYLDGSGSLTASFSMKKLMSAVDGGDAGGGDGGSSGDSGGTGGGGVDAGASIDMVHVSAEPKGDRIPVDVTVTASGQLGPVAATIEQFGLEAELSFPETGGNLGVANVDIGVSPPKGVGLSVDASAVVGGGYLSFDPENGRYTGALTLKVGELTLNAIGLLTTGTGDGEGGFSLLVIITADFPPVQLGFGFTLNAVGGLLGVNRGARVDPLRAGVRDGSLKSVLFPEDPARNAPQLVSDLRRFFPRVDGQYIFGPMAELGWGTPTILRAQVGILVEIPAPLRIAILGRIEAVLPDEEVALIALRMNALGVLDIGGKSLSVDASLYDSRVVAYTLTGDMAMRSRWGDNAMFGLSVGGFHPKFDPPPAFPDMRRVSISLSKGNNPRLRLSGYFAVTSNTVQAGAHVDLYARAAGFTVDGHLGFDALFQFDPFKFIVDVAAGISVKGHGISLGIHLSGSLSGPSPWHIKGKATVDLFLISATVRVEATMGESRRGTFPPADVYGKVREALSRPGNWTGQLPAGGESIVSLREIEPGDDEVLAHPLGSLSVRQRIAPLGVAIETFGSAKPTGYGEFEIDSVAVAGQPDEDLTGGAVREQFAPAQFFELSDSEKLSRPSFERFEAGHDVTNGLLAFGGQSGGGDGTLGPQATTETLAFESTYIDRNRETEGTLSTTKLSVGAADALTATSAVAKAETRTAGNAQFETATPNAVSISDTSYVVVDSETLTRIEAPALPGASGTTRTEAEQAMAAYLENRPGEADGLRVVATHEAVAPDGGSP